MYHSMTDLADDFRIFAFCMDDVSHESIRELHLNHIVPIKYSELENHDNELYRVKQTRSLVEYYFTCTPAICCYVFDLFPEVDLLTYLDSDLLFFSSPEKIFDEIGESSIAVVEHRFSRFGRKFLKLGIFNVAWISYRRDDQGLNCLREYRKQCLEWCFDYLDGDKYADQKYLDKWPEKYSNLMIIKNKGVNLACWNIGNYSVKKVGNTIFADEDELVFFHFAGLKQLIPDCYTTSISSYYVRLNKTVKDYIYIPYLKRLKHFTKDNDITKKTINPKYLKFSLSRSVKNLLRKCRIYFYNDLVKL